MVHKRFFSLIRFTLEQVRVSVIIDAFMDRIKVEIKLAT